MSRIWSVAGFLAASTACFPTAELTEDGDFVATRAMRLDAQVALDVDGAAWVEVTLVHGRSSVVLSGEDRLVVSHADRMEPMVEAGGQYTASIEDPVGGEVLEVLLERTGVDPVRSSVEVPAPLELHVCDGGEASRAAPLFLCWTPQADGVVDVLIEGYCIESFSGSFPDTDGRLTVPVGAFGNHIGDCEVHLTATRTVPGAVSYRYEDGTIEATLSEVGALQMLP